MRIEVVVLLEVSSRSRLVLGITLALSDATYGDMHWRDKSTVQYPEVLEIEQLQDN